MAIAGILAEKEELEKIVKLSHVQEVMELLYEWFDDFHWFVDCNRVVKRYIGANTNMQSYFIVRYDAINGYKIGVNICKKSTWHKYQNYTGVVEDDAAKIYEIVMKELM